jgi:hypothetical protein
MTTPYTIPHNSQDISDAIGQVVNADSVPQNPSQNMVTSEGIKTYVDGATTNLTTNSFSNATLVKEADNIVNNDNDNTIPTCAAVKDFVDNKDLGSGYTLLSSTNSTTGTASASGFLVIGYTTTTSTQDLQFNVTIAGTTFPTYKSQHRNSNIVTLPIAAGESYDINVLYGSTVRVYFKPFA